MEEIAWKRDKTPYLVFPCMKCEQFTYVKTIQKTKRCVRCGHSHLVTEIVNRGEIVKGISSAVETVKKRQDEFALKELGTNPEFRASNDFKIQKLDLKQSNIFDVDTDDDSHIKFKELLIEISNLYREFPFYIIEIKAENYGFSDSEVKLLTRNFVKKGTLIELQGSMFKLNK